VGLHETIVGSGQLTGRVEADFLVFYQGKVLLCSGVPTVLFTANDCMTRPDEVVAELLSILKG
jgi:hypothetical protein